MDRTRVHWLRTRHHLIRRHGIFAFAGVVSPLPLEMYWITYPLKPYYVHDDEKDQDTTHNTYRSAFCVVGCLMSLTYNGKRAHTVLGDLFVVPIPRKFRSRYSRCTSISD